MFDATEFPITRRWPAQHPERLQLYSLPTPNGVKVSIMLEETGLPYEAHLIDIGQNETWTPEFLSLNPNGKIPAILDPAGPDGKPLALFESGAILLYLAEKCGEFLPQDPVQRIETIQWVFFQMAAVGRCSASSASSTNSPDGNTKTSARCSAIRKSLSACSACWKPGWKTVNGSWARTTPSPISPCSAGCAT
ncbi:GST-like protein yfcG [Serratia rubidaea]|uniref:GST-like protein yfcG n=1 Tax=Serratia rubidaea TaxID=61652 RepID=A0A3S5DFG5_SERRU|nr:GST-like protein yfcG [Serratia rubidaea]